MDNNKRFSNKLNEYFMNNIKLSYVSKYEVILITKDGKFYEFEKDLFINYLLITSVNPEIIDTIINKSLVKELCGKIFTDFKCGFWHKIALTNDKKLYCWGKNECGVIGNGVADNKMYKPTFLISLWDKNIINICCGRQFILALTESGQVYSWGKNNRGQVGNGTYANVLEPYRLSGFNDEKIKKIACGEEHSMALTENGAVYSWGQNKYGQIGQITVDSMDCNTPKLLNLNGIIIQKITCGRRHSLLLSIDKDIYVFGNNYWMQISPNKVIESIYTPTRLTFTEKVIDIVSDSWYDISAALSENGFYYIWGKWGEDENVINAPKQTQSSFEDVFTYYFDSNYKPIKSKLIPFVDKCIRDNHFKSQYLCLETLGRGCYGKVVKVKDKNRQTDEFYAIKKIKFLTERENVFLKELETCSKIKDLNDKRLVRYYDIWLEKDSKEQLIHYIAMELCDYTLRKIINDMKRSTITNDCLSPISYYIASKIFSELLEGVKYLQNMNIIHRDLKPDNIMLKIDNNKREFIKICDFGLAAIHENKFQSHTNGKGPTKYAAPEVLEGRNYDTKADIYSLGKIVQELFNIDPDREYSKDDISLLKKKYQAISDLFEIMTGIRPYKRPNCEEILKLQNQWSLTVDESNANMLFIDFEQSKKNQFPDLYKLIKHVLYYEA